LKEHRTDEIAEEDMEVIVRDTGGRRQEVIGKEGIRLGAKSMLIS
jgi:hypothetical protein